MILGSAKNILTMILKYLSKPTTTVKNYIVKLLILLSTASLLVSLGSFCYILFYNFVIPDISHSGSLNFLFSECGNKRCNHPSAVVDFEDTSFDFRFKRGEQYEFVVDLLVPESPSNYDVGMFVLSIEFEGDNIGKKDEKRFVYRKEKKSTMLRYKSPPLRLLSSLLYSPLIVYGFTEEAQKISTTVVSNYEVKPEFAVRSINIVLESHRLNIYEAELTIRAKLVGFRYFMYHYPILSFLIGYPVFLIPVVATFFSITSNTFERKKKRLAELIYRTVLNVDFSSEASSEVRGISYKESEEKDFGDESENEYCEDKSISSENSLENPEEFKKINDLEKSDNIEIIKAEDLKDYNSKPNESSENKQPPKDEELSESVHGSSKMEDLVSTDKKELT